MNQWGAVKLGLAVAMAGTLGVLVTSKAPMHLANSPRAADKGLYALSSTQSMVSGAASSLDKASSSESGLRGIGAISGGGGASKDNFQVAASRGAIHTGLQPPGAVKKIVRTATLYFEVKDQAKARGLVHGVVIRHGAEIFAKESSGNGDNESGVIVIQTSPDKVDAILRDLEPLGRSISRSVSSDNMSEEYVDLKSRLENYRKVEARLTSLMEFKTNKLSDILELEQQLERVGGQIEQTLGRMKYIDTLAASSRITVRMSQPVITQEVRPAEAPGIFAQARSSLAGSFNTFVTTGLSLLNLTGFVLAIGLWTMPATGILWVLKKRIFE